MNRQSFRAGVYAVTLWLVGSAWGSIVFMRPALKAVSGIRFVLTNLAISVPIPLASIPLAWWLARRWLQRNPIAKQRDSRLACAFR